MSRTDGWALPRLVYSLEKWLLNQEPVAEQGSDAGSGSGREAMITKIFWATWHRNLGVLAMDVLGAESEITEAAPYSLSALQRMYLFTRSDTIYAGSNEIQRNIIAERALGLPREPRPA